MKETSKESELRAMLERSVKNKDMNAGYYRSRAVFARISNIISAALINVFAGLKGGTCFDSNTSTNIVLVLGAFMTAINAWNEFWKNPDLWLSNTQSANQLRALWTELDYQASQGQIELPQLDQYFDRYQSIMSGSNESWIGARVKGISGKKEEEIT